MMKEEVDGLIGALNVRYISIPIAIPNVVTGAEIQE